MLDDISRVTNTDNVTLDSDVPLSLAYAIFDRCSGHRNANKNMLGADRTRCPTALYKTYYTYDNIWNILLSCKIGR